MPTQRMPGEDRRMPAEARPTPRTDTSSPAQGNFNAGRYGAENNMESPTPYQPTPQMMWDYDAQSRQGVRQSVTRQYRRKAKGSRTL